jgi:hypothetical protein
MADSFSRVGVCAMPPTTTRAHTFESWVGVAQLVRHHDGCAALVGVAAMGGRGAAARAGGGGGPHDGARPYRHTVRAACRD